ncbi:MAG: SUMF1/EgtB/PvdO family nonheme iron enzyme [Prevotella sp.]|nr:SUMF1/EgtB/PvdO family nonheme iron enzyme [Prevotella sp.]
MIRVDGGTFQMGATSEQGISTEVTNEKPVHKVTLSTYYIGETEVTQGLWYAIMGQKPSSDKEWRAWGLGSDYPAYYISWNLAQEFITKLNSVTGRKFRLPTEAEWEFAARGGTKTKGYKYAGSNKIDEVAWYQVNPAEQTHPVATKKANELGLYDMSGNVREWCSDWYDYSYYKNSTVSNPTGPSTGENRVMRGGSISNNEDECRVSRRDNRAPTSDTYPNGLRIALQY